jgi:response regulator of citrate/malate metabolism
MQEKIFNLYVDDLRQCPDNFILAKNMNEAINILKKYKIDILSLDHDLGEDENGKVLPTGYDLVKHICENNYSINKIYIHTANPVGRENMYQTLIGAQKRGFINKDIVIYNYPYNK